MGSIEKQPAKINRANKASKDRRVNRGNEVNKVSKVSRVRAKVDHNKVNNKVNSKVVSKAAHKAVAHKTVRDNMVSQPGVLKEMPGATIDSSVPNGANDFAKLKIYDVNGAAVRRWDRGDNWMK